MLPGTQCLRPFFALFPNPPSPGPACTGGQKQASFDHTARGGEVMG
jgi:hypothetical protein